MLKRMLLVAALAVTTSVSAPFILPQEAEAATNCLRFGTVNQYGSRAQSVTNTCNQRVHMIWCHNMSGRSYESGRCGRNGKFYQKEWIFAPGERYSNQYSLPISARIEYGACRGGANSAIPTGNSGSYNCR